ncbi:hypothetical protein J7J00_01575 [Bacillus sp. ISL-4]|uniref:hypothetical protein n=1 Tax=Bacillus sp. ISL-4 TaxID=2819125 RepID=UPI001BE87B67|nr:hypothetical protein [Bacillus sp. ISL-4]MBT2664198.1 hypothetical protein [Bacillus sp. ISL-4]
MFQLIGTEGTRLLLRKVRPRETHRRKERRGVSRTARGKRVPEVEIKFYNRHEVNVPP